MKRLILFLALFWNLENFFDYVDSGANSSDAEFSSRGERHWTRKRFQAKCNAIAKTIFWGDDIKGGLPDVVCFAEVENRRVLQRLVDSTALYRCGYEIVHYDSPDPRGIDCALLYRRECCTLVSSSRIPVSGVFEGDTLRTRDILLAQLVTDKGDSIAVLVNHHPSKYGGGRQWRREMAVERLKAVSDSLEACGWKSRLALGDFNDTPDNPLYDTMAPSLLPLSKDCKFGSIRFNGQWELIDLAFASPFLAPRCRFNVLRVPFLMVRDSGHSGDKPLRTYSGPRYLGGVSDHCPITIEIQ